MSPMGLKSGYQQVWGQSAPSLCSLQRCQLLRKGKKSLTCSIIFFPKVLNSAQTHLWRAGEQSQELVPPAAMAGMPFFLYLSAARTAWEWRASKSLPVL